MVARWGWSTKKIHPSKSTSNHRPFYEYRAHCCFFLSHVRFSPRTAFFVFVDQHPFHGRFYDTCAFIRRLLFRVRGKQVAEPTYVGGTFHVNFKDNRYQYIIRPDSRVHGTQYYPRQRQPALRCAEEVDELGCGASALAGHGVVASARQQL